MKIMVIGASRGLGRAFVEGLSQAGHSMIGVSRQNPHWLTAMRDSDVKWIEADMAQPKLAAQQIAQDAPEKLDALIYNIGIWEETAFTNEYAFTREPDDAIAEMVDVNITATLLLLKALIPRLLAGAQPRIVLTGSTSGLRQSGRPEMAFGASKFALNGMADALREGFRAQRLAVTCLQLGYLNTEDDLATPIEQAARNGEGKLVPVHDVVAVVQTLLQLSDATFIRELVMPAILDERF